MTLTNRLATDPDEAQFMIVQKSNLALPHRPFQGAINGLRDLLYRHDQTREGIVLLTPTGYEHGIGVHFLAIAQTVDRARDFAQQALERLTRV